MRLQYVTLLMLISDGVDESEYMFLRNAFKGEGAEMLTISHLPYETVQSVLYGQGGRDIGIDMPLVQAYGYDFSGVVIPGGEASVAELSQSKEVNEFITWCHWEKKSVFALGEAAEIVQHVTPLQATATIEAGTSLQNFLRYASDILTGKVRQPRYG
jgi:putative intracellular protease/amidase